jgi:DNA topoisomerase I
MPRADMPRTGSSAASAPQAGWPSPRPRRKRKSPAADPPASAREAGLRYVRDGEPGIRRQRTGRGCRYLAPDGSPVRDPGTLERIAALAIPPAWRDVWICADPDGHIQAVGKDARGRRQYIYHPHWRAVRDEVKFGQAIAFGEALQDIRRRVEADLALPGLPREKVLAVILRLLDRSLIRIGNPEYARHNQSFGLTTLLVRHVDVRGTDIHFSFRGKSGISHEVEVTDRRVARILRRLVELPGEEVFQYLDEEARPRGISSADVNAYLREIAGQDFSAKDFRTWAASVLALRALQARPPGGSRSARRRSLGQAIDEVAQALGNSRTLCRKCYVHPDLIDAYLDGRLPSEVHPEGVDAATSAGGLSAEECAALRFLRGRIDSAQSRAARGGQPA